MDSRCAASDFFSFGTTAGRCGDQPAYGTLPEANQLSVAPGEKALFGTMERNEAHYITFLIAASL